MKKSRILIVDDERAARYGLKRALGTKEHDIAESEDGLSALEQVREFDPDIVICDIKMPRLDGMGFLRKIREQEEAPLVIMVTAYGSERMAVDAIKAGAYYYLSKPYDIDEVRLLVQNALEKIELSREARELRSELRKRDGFGQLIGQSEKMRKVYDLILKVARADVTVLIRGESGTGKELVARAIHEQSSRKNRPFISMNCAALPRDLIESELFGHEKGAFTGASSRRVGKFELADGGSLFLDEIGDMSTETQAKILRVLQEQRFERLGGTGTIEVDVRVISATNRNLMGEIQGGRFREDLYYRIKVVEIPLPPLRERKEDIPLLSEHLLDSFSRKHGKKMTEISSDAMKILTGYHWPGNVRQLMNVIESSVVLAEGDTLKKEHLPPDLRDTWRGRQGIIDDLAEGELAFQDAKKQVVRSFEIDFLSQALERSRGNVSEAALNLGMKRQALQQKLRELGINATEFRKR